ncbi:hypothetical protein [Thermovibrio sp.]
MVELSSRWILQELFVDPSFEGELGEGELYLKVASEVEKRDKEHLLVVVELSGSVINKKAQVANFRFVSTTEVEASARRKKSAVKKVEERRKSELLTLLPLYLLKAGIILRKVKVEL